MRRGSSMREAGISLIELVVAMAVFALIAVMGLQSLTGTVRISERLSQIDTQTEDVGNALALLRNDLTSLVPMLFYPPQDAPRPAVDWSANKGQASLSLAGQSALVPTHTNRNRVDWFVDPATDTLMRQTWPALIPSATNQRGTEMPVLAGVTGLEMRTFWPESGWVDGHRAPQNVQPIIATAPVDQDGGGTPPPVYFSTLPIAIEITVQSERFGALRLIETLR